LSSFFKIFYIEFLLYHRYATATTNKDKILTRLQQLDAGYSVDCGALVCNKI